MKKFLYSTTALAVAGALTFGSDANAAAKPIKIAVGGFMTTEMGFGNNNGEFETGGATTTATSNKKSSFNNIQDSEILICRIVAPSWAPVFSRIAAAVSDVGGIMAHSAIISREYGLPSVVGTGFATANIQTGDLVEVDGDAGTVRVLERAPG